LASIDRVATRSGTRWRARWRTPDGKSRSQTFERRADAERHLTRVEHSRFSGTYLDPREGQITLREFGERWRARQGGDERTKKNREGILRNHVYPTSALCPWPPSGRETARRGWPRSSGRCRAPCPCAKSRSTSAPCCDPPSATTCAARTQWPTSSCPPAPAKERIVPVTTGEFLALADAIDPVYRALVLFAGFVGPRQGELLGLTRDRVDLRRRTVLIDRQLKEGRFAKVKNWKTRLSRIIPLCEPAADAIEPLLRRPATGPDAFLFTTADGRPLDRKRLHEAWSEARVRVQLRRNVVVFHDLRHYYVSVLISQGFDVEHVADLIGDTSETVVKCYSHLWPRDQERVKAQLHSAFRAVLDEARGDAAGERSAPGDAPDEAA
jgi:integrase